MEDPCSVPLPEQACLQAPAESDIYDLAALVEESSEACSAGCLSSERLAVAPVATPVLWGEASGCDGLGCELGFGFGEGAGSVPGLDAGSPFPCMASILEKQIAEAEQLFPAPEDPSPLGCGVHASRSCTDLTELAAPGAFGLALAAPATPAAADALAARPAEPALSATRLEAAPASDDVRLPGAPPRAAAVRLGLAFNGAAAVRERCGPLLASAAWRGCARSAWCRRDSKHRGVCNALAAAPGLPGAALSDAPAPPAAAAFVTIGGESEGKVPKRLSSPSPLVPDSEQGSAADTSSPLAAHVAAAAAAPAECESGNEEGGGSGAAAAPGRALLSASLDSQQSSGSGSASVQRRSCSAAWASAGADPEATDLSGLSAKSGASADSDDDDGAARSPLRPLPARALPPLPDAAAELLGHRAHEPGKGVKRKAGRPKGREGARPAKRPAAPARSVGVVAPGQQCTQCGTQVTPVWRAGPSGPKTLCNACGVRYMKSAKKR